MKIDLSHIAGFPLVFDTKSMDISTIDMTFKRQGRGYGDLAAVLQTVVNPPPTGDIYFTYTLSDSTAFNALYKQHNLTFGLVLLPPGMIGDEYIKTHGHYHSSIPGSQTGYPEVYTHYYGNLYLMMQRRAKPEHIQLDDCVLYKMVAGHSITIPPGYAHILINPSREPGLMAGLYSLDSVHNYEPIDRMKGAAYYLNSKYGQERIIPNPAYSSLPPMRILTNLDETPFFPPDAAKPLWLSFVRSPDRYAFLYDPDAARLQFKNEDLRV